MKKLFVLLAVMAFALTPCLAQTGKVNNFKIKRGTNVSHWLSQSEARGEMRRLHIQETGIRLRAHPHRRGTVLG